MNLKNLSETLTSRTFPLPTCSHWIAGRWHEVGKVREENVSINPSRGTKIATFGIERQTIATAVQAANTAMAEMAKLAFARRTEILERLAHALGENREILIQALQIEVGKPRWEASAEVTQAIAFLQRAVLSEDVFARQLLAPAQLGNNADLCLFPVGICAVYLPFSAPLTHFAVSFSAAMLSGCPMLMFSSAHGVLLSMALAGISAELDLMPGAFNVLLTGFKGFKLALTFNEISCVVYTGSHEHCAEIYRDYRGPYRRQLVLQSGGKNALIVHSTADLQAAAKAIVFGACRSAGQLCASTSRVFVYRSQLPELSQALERILSKMLIGPTDGQGAPDPFMGPLFSRKGLEKFLRFQTMANREAKGTILWGRTLEVAQADGFFVTPAFHVIEKFDPTSAYQSNVIFCPDVAIYTYDVLDTAIAQINETDATLSVSFFGDGDILKSRRSLFQAPNLLLNMPTVEAEACLPLAGRSQFGRNRYQGLGLSWYLSYPQALTTEAVVDPELAGGWGLL